jgi:hypothetical protein
MDQVWGPTTVMIRSDNRDGLLFSRQAHGEIEVLIGPSGGLSWE